MQHHIIHEALDFKSLIASAAFTDWLSSGMHMHISDDIYGAYIDYLASGMNYKSSISFSEKGGSSGFVFSDLKFSIEDLKFFQLALVSHLKLMGYIINLAEQKFINGNSTISPSTVFYMKPSLRLNIGRKKSIQLFGNLHIECFETSEGMARMRFITHTYNDYNFESPEPFSELMEAVFKELRETIV